MFWNVEFTLEWFIIPKFNLVISANYTYCWTALYSLNLLSYTRSQNYPTTLFVSLTRLVTNYVFGLPRSTYQLSECFFNDNSDDKMVEFNMKVFHCKNGWLFEIPSWNDGKTMPVVGIFPENGLIFGYIAIIKWTLRIDCDGLNCKSWEHRLLCFSYNLLFWAWGVLYFSWCFVAIRLMVLYNWGGFGWLCSNWLDVRFDYSWFPLMLMCWICMLRWSADATHSKWLFKC